MVVDFFWDIVPDIVYRKIAAGIFQYLQFWS